ncbi:MAG: rRNA maturation RNase YbeY [Pirellulaceae bacterium]
MSQPAINLEIEYHFDGTRTEIREDQPRFRQAAAWVCKKFEISSLSVSVAIVSDSEIHRLNREHLQHDWPTDVISFVFEHSESHVEGEVIASYDTAQRLAKKANWSPEDELLLYVLHGLLHVAGLDDVEESDRKQMRLCEKDCLLHFKIPGAQFHLERWQDVSY